MRQSLSFALGEGDVQVSIEDEDGKIDLNEAPLELLAGLFMALDLPEPRRRRLLAERIGDFRDAGQRARAARRRGRRPTSPPASRKAPPIGPFVSGSRTGARARHDRGACTSRSGPIVTVYSGAEGIDPTRATRLALQALPGIPPELVEALLTAGADVDPFGLLDDQSLPEELEQYIVPSRELVFTIRALGRTSGGGRFMRQAVIELGASADQPFLVYAWNRGTLPETGG